LKRVPPGQLATSSMIPLDVLVHLINFEQSVAWYTIEPPLSQPTYFEVTVAAIVAVVEIEAVEVVGCGVVVDGMIYALQTTFEDQSHIFMSELKRVPLGHCCSIGTISPLTLSHL